MKIVIYSCYGGTKKEISRGSTLKEALLRWENKRDNNDDIYYFYRNSYCNSKFYDKNADFEENIENYLSYLWDIDENELFEIMRDGNYNFYEVINNEY